MVLGPLEMFLSNKIILNNRNWHCMVGMIVIIGMSKNGLFNLLDRIITYNKKSPEG